MVCFYSYIWIPIDAGVQSEQAFVIEYICVNDIINVELLELDEYYMCVHVSVYKGDPVHMLL